MKAVEDKRQICLAKRWKFKNHKGQVIVARDVCEKITRWVQKFQNVGDIIVQYDPVHASLPWAAVRLLLQVVTNDVQKFGAIVEGVETVALVITRYTIVEHLYLTKSTKLRDELTDGITRLYAETLRFLSEACRYYSQSTAVRVAKSLVQTSASSNNNSLASIAQSKSNVDALTRLVEAECQSMALSEITNQGLLMQVEMSIVTDSIDTTRRELTCILKALEEPFLRVADQLQQYSNSLQRDEYTRICRWLSTVPFRQHHRTHLAGLIPGSGEWFLNDSKFVDWRRSSSSSILWLHGVPGSGKTKLISLAIESLRKEVSSIPDAAPLAYFYCSRNQAESQRAEPEEILRALVKQMACRDSGSQVGQNITQEYEQATREAAIDGLEPFQLDLQSCIRLILSFTEQVPVTFVIDAVDECSMQKRFDLFQALDKIVHESASVVKVLLSSRDDVDIAHRMASCVQIAVSQDRNLEDIVQFAILKLSEAIETKRLLGGDVRSELRNRILGRLIAGSQGM